MNGSKRWFQTKFWFWLKHVLLVAFLNSTFFNNNKTYCIIQHKKMLTFLQLFYIFPVFYKKGIFAKETCFWQSIRRFTLFNYFSVQKNYVCFCHWTTFWGKNLFVVVPNCFSCEKKLFVVVINCFFLNTLIL